MFRTFMFLLALGGATFIPGKDLIEEPLVLYPNDLSRWIPQSISQVAAVTIRCLRAVHVFHTRGVLHGKIVSTSFAYKTNPNEVVLKEFAPYTPAFSGLEYIHELEQVIAISSKLFAKVSPDTVPLELALCSFKLASTTAYSETLLLDLIDSMQRMVDFGVWEADSQTDVFEYVQKYQRRLTVEGAMLLTSTSPIPTIDALKKCIPYILKSSSLPGTFLTTNRGFFDIEEVMLASATRIGKPGSLSILVSKDPRVAIRESAVLEILKNADIVESVAVNLPHECQQHVSVKLLHWWDIPLKSLGSTFSEESLTKFTIAALTTLRSIHQKGFVHGSIGIDSFLLRRGRVIRNFSKLRLTGFRYATPWIRPSPNPYRNTIEMDTQKSVFELEGYLPNRLDDILRLCELVFRLSGQPRFQPSSWENGGQDVLIIKRGHPLVVAVGYNTPMSVMTMYEDIKQMDPYDEPKYDFWLSLLSH